MSEMDSGEATPKDPSAPKAPEQPAAASPAVPELPEVPVRPTGGATEAPPTWMQRLMQDRDVALLVLLAVLNIGSAYTTIIGARQVLPAGMSDIVGAAVQAMLFLMLAGFAMNRSFFRRWFAIALFAFASVYTSFFTYYEQLAKEADLRVELDRAMQVHATLVSEVYQPARSRADKLNGEAEAMIDLADREASRGSTTGQEGYGPVARKYAEQGNRMLVEAQRLEADVNRLQGEFEYEMEGLTAEDVYRRDLKAWQLAPMEWKGEVPAPSRDDYVDMDAQVALLTPYNRVRAGEMPAMTALGLAMMVDGIAIFLGTAIQARRQRTVESRSREAAVMIREARRSWQHLWGAMSGREPHSSLTDPAVVDDDVPLDLADLPLAGTRGLFLSRFYEAIHPQTMRLAFHELQRSPDDNHRIAARMLVDQLRELGWVVVGERGHWRVPGEHYVPLTRWLTQQIRRAQDEEQGGEGGAEPESTERDFKLVKDGAA